MSTIKGLSLWQPWAVVMETGAKRNETRSWPTKHRGPLAIQASKKRPTDIVGLLGILRDDWAAWAPALRDAGCPIDEHRRVIGLGGLAYGAIACVVNVVDCVSITAENAPSWPERAFGDYTPGRFMFVTDRVVRLAEPVPFRGAQGMFDVPVDLLGDAVERLGCRPAEASSLFQGARQ